MNNSNNNNNKANDDDDDDVVRCLRTVNTSTVIIDCWDPVDCGLFGKIWI